MSILSQNFIESQTEYTIPGTTWLDFPKFCATPILSATEYLDILVAEKTLVRVVSMAGKTMVIFVYKKEVHHMVFNCRITFNNDLFWKPKWGYLEYLEESKKQLKLKIIDKNGKLNNSYVLYIGKPHLF
jgi:hypothetical protein